MEPIFFSSQEKFREWLEQHHETEKELLVGFHKVRTGKPSMTWSESVDQALCFGWIDGVRRSLGEESYTIRFTPRKPTSNWSAINIAKVKGLTKKGLMRPAGLAAFAKRSEHKSAIYAYENRPKEFLVEYEKRFKKHRKAWEFFRSQAPSYQRVAIYWVMSAKQETTRLSRLEKLISTSADRKRM
jgi:uncharacterized protein YdeI (YjbR/CyaY-like superfamily)